MLSFFVPISTYTEIKQLSQLQGELDMSKDFKKRLFENTADAFISNPYVLVESPNESSILI